MRVLRIIGSICIALYLIFAPRMLFSGVEVDRIQQLHTIPEPQFQGTALLYHVVSDRTYTGSVTNWLKDQAKKFEEENDGAHLMIEGMCENDFYERIAYGRTADGYSFFSGSLYADLLQPIELESPVLRSGLSLTELAVPYFYTGKVLVTSEKDRSLADLHAEGKLACSYLDLARLQLQNEAIPQENATAWYTDWYTAHTLLIDDEGGGQRSLCAVDSYTDAVCWLGLSRECGTEQARILSAFYAYLLEEKPQRSVNAFGACSVREDVADAACDPALEPLMQTYQTVVTPHPFRYAAEYDALRTDAELSVRGDAYAMTRFHERLRHLLLT